MIDTAAMEADIRAELGAPIFMVDDDPEAVPRPLTRERTPDAETVDRLRRLFTRLENGE